jgi:hypothetical protein
VHRTPGPGRPPHRCGVLRQPGTLGCVTPAPTRHQFLSDEWIDAVTHIREEYEGQVTPPTVVVRANVVVTDAPFGDGEVRGFVDTSHRGVVIEPGELDAADFTASLDYETAKALFVEQDPQALMQAFLGGKIRITGDATKLLALPLPKPDATGPEIDLAREIADRIRAVTL